MITLSFGNVFPSCRSLGTNQQMRIIINEIKSKQENNVNL